MFGSKSNPFADNKSSVDIEGVILDSELLLKYRFVERAISTLEKAIESCPKNISLREKLLEIYVDYNLPDKGAEQALALSKIYAESGDIDRANENIMQAKGLNPALSINLITPNAEAPRRAITQPLQPIPQCNIYLGQPPDQCP
ncbi:MAG: hypothetical protein IPK14_17465 [Blastocatellia bacterium]|nr:hypothetical protein [Blastocatellia bacterium]